MRLNWTKKSLAAGLCGFTASLVHADTLRVYNWTDYIAPDVLEAFTEETGITVTIESYLHPSEAEGVLAAGKSGYDLAVVATESVGRIRQAGGLSWIGQSHSADFAILEQGLWEMAWTAVPDVKNYSIPYVWGTTGLAYDVEAVSARLPEAPLDSWALVFDPENAARLSDCGISVVDSSEEVVSVVLAYLGKDPNSRSEDDLDAAFHVLGAISPYITYFDTEQFDQLNNGDACVAVSWSSEAYGPIIESESDVHRYVLPKEGTNLWADTFVIPTDATNPELAMAFVKFLARPEVFAVNSEWVYGIVRDAETRAAIEVPAFEDPPLSLPPEMEARLFMMEPRDGVEKHALDRRWRRMRLGL